MMELSKSKRKAIIREIIDVLSNSSGVIISSHIDSDGDGIGSMVALWRALRAKNISSYLIWDDETPERIKFLIEDCEITRREPDVYDIAVVLDSGDLNRLKPKFKKMLIKCNKVINIDHHKSNSIFGDINFVDVLASSTVEMVLELIDALRIELTFDIALPIYVGLLTDTGGFSYANTKVKSHLNAVRLIKAGVDPYLVYKVLNENKDIRFLKLLGEVLNSIKIESNGRIALIKITNDMLNVNQFDSREINGFIDYARSVKGIDVAVLLREENSKVRVSLRSKGEVDVNEVAKAFGGGGHERAAGFTLDGDISHVEMIVLDALNKVLKNNIF
ncbi:MAG: DHH family phosphoesterase [bacterium]